MTPHLIGSALTLIPLLIFGIAFFRKNLPIFGFYLALCIVGVGYLLATGAIEDIGTWALLSASQPVKN